MQCAATQSGAVLQQLQLLAAWFAKNGVVVVARLLANQEYGIGFLLTLGHVCLSEQIGWNSSFSMRRDLRSDYAVVLWFLASLELTFVAFGPRDLRFW